MATKGSAVGGKRKAASVTKGKSDGMPKMAKLENGKKPEPVEDDSEDDFESFSDSDDGGATLDDDASSKGFKGSDSQANGKSAQSGKDPSHPLELVCP